MTIPKKNYAKNARGWYSEAPWTDHHGHDHSAQRLFSKYTANLKTWFLNKDNAL